MSISSPPNYGSPDWQRGYYSAQKLLGGGSIVDNHAVVTIPPNCETLVVVVPGGSSTAQCTCVGFTTGTKYNGSRINASAAVVSDPSFFFDVSQSVDNDVTVTINAPGHGSWFVYADAGVHMVADASKLTNYQGIPYSIPSVPNTAAGDHPLNELQYVGSQVAASTTLINAPGAGQRIRMFSAWITVNGTHTALINEPGSRWFVACQGGGANSVTFQPTGIPLAANTAVGLVCTTGDNVGYGVSYTVETI